MTNSDPLEAGLPIAAKSPRIPWLPLHELWPDIETPDPAEQLVWHYTPRDAIQQILEGHVLWASEFRSLNDRSELLLGVRRVRSALKNMRRTWSYYDSGEPDIDFDELEEMVESAESDALIGSEFVCSFSRAGDSTDQWKAYAGADGFALAIPQGVRLPVLGESAEYIGKFDYIDETPLRWVPLVYRKRQQKAAALEGLNRFIGEMQEAQFVASRHDDDVFHFSRIFRDRASSVLTDAVASIKHKDFSVEREVRYVVSRPDNANAIHTRDRAGAQVSYVKLTGAEVDLFDRNWSYNEPNYYQASPSLLPLRKIRVGPGNDYKATKAWLKSHLDELGYAGVKIEKSKSTFK